MWDNSPGTQMLNWRYGCYCEKLKRLAYSLTRRSEVFQQFVCSTFFLLPRDSCCLFGSAYNKYVANNLVSLCLFILQKQLVLCFIVSSFIIKWLFILDDLGRKAEEVMFNFSLGVLSGFSLHKIKQAWCTLGEFLP